MKITDWIWPKNPFSLKAQKEKVTLSVHRLKETGQKTLADGWIESVAGLALAGVQELLTQQSEKYTQKYKGSLGVIDFFKDDGALNCQSLCIEREVQLEETADKNLAAIFSFSFDRPNNEKFFRLVAKKPKINFSKCKVPKTKSTVNVRVKWVFETVWSVGLEPKKQIIHEEEFDFGDVPLKGNVEKRSDKCRNDLQSFNNNEMTGSWIPCLPKGAALNIRCEIVESAEAGKKFEKAAKLLKDNKETIAGLVGKESSSSQTTTTGAVRP